MPGKHINSDAAQAIAFSKKISSVVSHLMKLKKLRQVDLANEIGYSRSNFCELINSSNEKRLWRLPAVIGICRVLGITMTDMMRAVECIDDESLKELELVMAIYQIGTEPHSEERLHSVVSSVVNYNKVSIPLQERNVRVLKLGCPKFVKDYIDGTLNDRNVVDIVQKALEAKGDLPFWASIAEIYEKQ